MAETEPSFNQSGSEFSKWLSDFRMALGFLTRLPLKIDWETGDLARAFRAFPIAGAVIGSLGGLAYWAAISMNLPPLIAAFIAIAALILLTGGLHEDGLADLADGFGGGVKKEDKLRIMKDSAIGSYGVLALIIGVGLRIICISEVADPKVVFGLLVGSGALSRAVMPIIMSYLDPAKTDGLAVSAGRPSQLTGWIAGGLGVVLALLFIGSQLGMVALFGAFCGAIVIAAIAVRQIGGYTGDVLGSVQQVSEICILLAVVMTL
ncbi:MAG: adenosylcobinamide-GDP ribazoletransferase [Rhodospirillales bacterium]|nr:adenosylcobinamide-GDP ribazoletransferase [Rhodospirillales bacterium]